MEKIYKVSFSKSYQTVEFYFDNQKDAVDFCGVALCHGEGVSIKMSAVEEEVNDGE